MHDSHQGSRHPGWIGVLDDVAAVNDAGGALREEVVRALEDLAVTDLATDAEALSITTLEGAPDWVTVEADRMVNLNISDADIANENQEVM